MEKKRSKHKKSNNIDWNDNIQNPDVVKVPDEDDFGDKFISEDGEAEIQGETIKVNFSENRQLNLPDATVEEQENFQWSRMEKDIHHPLVSANKNMQGGPRRGMVKPEKPRSNRSRTSRNKMPNKKYPFHYYLAFYGIPAVILIVLIVLVIIRYQKFNSDPDIHIAAPTGPEAIWSKASDDYLKGNFCNMQAIQIHAQEGNSNRYRQKLVEAQKLLRSAIKGGEKALIEQVEIEMKENKRSRKDAEAFVNQTFSIYKEKIKKWNAELNTVLKKLKSLDNS